MKEKGLLIVFSGPSGVGKGAVLKKVLENNKNIKCSVSATTRPPREGEQNGKEYYFISKEEFKSLISKNKILEYTKYCDNYYGTLLDEVDGHLNNDNDIVLEIETDGKKQIVKKRPEVLSIFILPPSVKELKNRLCFRATEAQNVIDKRVDVAKSEIRQASDYDYIVINKNIDECANSVLKIIECEKMKSYRRINIIEEVLKNE